MPPPPLTQLATDDAIVHYKTEQSHDWILLPCPKKFNARVEFGGGITIIQKPHGNRCEVVLEPQQLVIGGGFFVGEATDTADYIVGVITCLETPSCRHVTDKVGAARDHGIRLVSFNIFTFTSNGTFPNGHFTS